jgi:dihydrolipoamide dehydrogenase
VVVLGGGPAGVTAALRARELGAQVALVQSGPLGGACANDGCAPTRVLARAARLVREADQYAHYGLVGAPPAVDFPQVLACAQQTVVSLHAKKQLRPHLEAMGVTVIERGRARFVDAHTLVCDEGDRVQGSKFILATGGHARRLSFPGSDLILTHSDVWSLTRLPSSIAIVGGAATGCQLASIFATFGARVHLLEVGLRLLSAEDEAVSAGIMRAFTRRNIDVITSIGGVERVEGQQDQLRLYYTHDGRPRTLDVEAALLAVGWQANSDELNLAVAGVQTERGYVQVDDGLRTSAPHICAAGDITGRMMLVQSACAEGVLAAESAVLGPGGRVAHRIVPHGGFTDPEYGGVGLTERRARELDDCVVAVVPYTQIDRALIDRHTEGFCKLIVSRTTHRLLGAHIVGEQAVETLQLIAAAMAADMWVEQIADLELAYPTFAAIVGLAARRIMRELGVVPLVPAARTAAWTAAGEWERSDLPEAQASDAPCDDSA